MLIPERFRNAHASGLEPYLATGRGARRVERMLFQRVEMAELGADVSVALTARQSMGEMYLQKPITVEGLTREVREVLDHPG